MIVGNVDRGYANPPGLSALVQAGADALARYDRGTLPLSDAHGQPFDALEHARGLRGPGAVREWNVALRPDQP